MAFLDILSGGITLPNIEVGTKKTQDTFTYSPTTTSVYSPTINRTFDIQYNIASEGSTISTKKEASVSQTPTTSPTVSPSFLISPAQSSSFGESSGSGGGIMENISDIAIIGALVVGAIFLVPEILNKPANTVKAVRKK